MQISINSKFIVRESYVPKTKTQPKKNIDRTAITFYQKIITSIKQCLILYT